MINIFQVIVERLQSGITIFNDENQAGLAGIYKCIIPDDLNTLQTLYVGSGLTGKIELFRGMWIDHLC